MSSEFEDEKNGMIYRIFLQPYQYGSRLDTWVISSQYQKKGESGFYSFFRILANGDAFFKNLTAWEKITCKDLEVYGSMKIPAGTTIPGTVSFEGIDVSGKVKCKTLEVEDVSAANLSVSNAFTGSIPVNEQRLEFKNGIAIKIT